MQEEGRLVRNLVLSVCEFKLVKSSSREGGSDASGQQSGISTSSSEGLPGGRVGSRLIVSRGTQLLLQGGADAEACYADLYGIELGRASCKELFVGGFSKPSGRFGHSFVVYDDYAILFGGLAAAQRQHMSSVKSSAPPPFIDPRASWQHHPEPSNELFTLRFDDLVWSQPETTGCAPSPRGFHSAVVCQDCMVVFGGVTDANFQESSNELYLLDLCSLRWGSAGAAERELEAASESNTEDWLSFTVSVTGPSPSPRFGHAMTALPRENRCLLFGGDEDGATLWSLTFKLHLEPPADDVSGGLCDQRPGGALKRVDAFWEKVQTSGTGPSSRRFHSFAVVGDSRIFVFGGQNISRPRDPASLYVLDLPSSRWRRPLYEGNQELRAHTDAVFHDKLIVFGGAEGTVGRGRLLTMPGEIKQENESCAVEVGTRTLSKRLLLLNVLEIKDGAGDSDFRFKLVTVGDSGVGKSCLLTRFVEDGFSEFHEATIGVDFRSVVTLVRGKVCTLQVWDTAGQERFSGMTSSYYRYADAFVLVYDSTRESSFRNLERWIRQIKEHHEMGPSTLKLVVGNKADLENEVVVSEDMARKYADSIGASFASTSAKTSANVDAAFLAIASKLVDMRRKAASAATVQSQSSGGSVPQSSGETSSGASTVVIADHAASIPRRPVCYGCANISSGSAERNAAQNQTPRRQTDEVISTGALEMT